jgi:hypothetical protein
VQGRDPLAEQRKAEASTQNTLRAVCENFLIREGGAKRDADGNLTFEGCTGKLRTAAERHATFERHVYPKLGRRPIEEIKRSDINALLDKIEDESGAAMADHTLAYVRRVFNWHASRSDRAFDERMLAALRKITEERDDDPFKVTLQRWTIHDLRRTARSLMTRAGVPPDHAERCLGHVIGGVRGVYDRHEYYDEKKLASEKLAALIERIVNPPADNVASLDERRAAAG